MENQEIIDVVNDYLADTIFDVELVERIIKIKVKIKIIGERELYSMGTPKNYYTYSVTVLPIEKNKEDIVRMLFDMRENDTMSFHDRSKLGGPIVMTEKQINSELHGILQIFSLEPNSILYELKLPKNNNMNESYLIEGKYDFATRQIVKDIIQVVKNKKIGSFSLPEDISNNLIYDFGGHLDSFSVELDIKIDENIQGYEVDGEYYRDDDTIKIEIIKNSIDDNQIIQNLIGDLNELVRHELEHKKQKGLGYKMKKEPTDPFKYYTQKREIEAQKAGFKRRAKQEKRNLEDVIRQWLEKNQTKHNLNPKEQEKLIKKLSSN